MVYVLYVDLDNYDYNLGVYMKDKWLYFETFLHHCRVQAWASRRNFSRLISNIYFRPMHFWTQNVGVQIYLFEMKSTKSF